RVACAPVSRGEGRLGDRHARRDAVVFEGGAGPRGRRRPLPLRRGEDVLRRGPLGPGRRGPPGRPAGGPSRPRGHRAARLPPGAPNWEVSSLLPVPWDVHVLTFMPHMHLRGKAFRYSVVRGLGQEESLLQVPAYDFNWQTPYRLAQPAAVPKNSMFKVVGT